MKESTTMNQAMKIKPRSTWICLFAAFYFIASQGIAQNQPRNPPVRTGPAYNFGMQGGSRQMTDAQKQVYAGLVKKYDKNSNEWLDRDEMGAMSQEDRRKFGALRGGRGGGLRADKSPAVGDVTPDFTLKILGSDTTVKLSEQYAQKPVVLTLGSYTCPPYRNALEGIEKLYKEQKEDCIFLFVYIREAHASDGRVSRANEYQNINILQHTTLGERSTAAKFCQGKINITMPILIDTMDNSTEQLFGGWPNRTYLIDKDGKIVYKGPHGPQGSQPNAVKKAIADLMSN